MHSRTADGEAIFLLWCEPSPAPRYQSSAPRRNFMGNQPALGCLLMAPLALFCSRLEIPVGQKMLCKDGIKKDDAKPTGCLGEET